MKKPPQTSHRGSSTQACQNRADDRYRSWRRLEPLLQRLFETPEVVVLFDIGYFDHEARAKGLFGCDQATNSSASKPVAPSPERGKVAVPLLYVSRMKFIWRKSSDR